MSKETYQISDKETYQISDKETGPWLAMDVYDTPQRALDAARGMFNWGKVYVAKMRAISAKDIIRDSVIADMEEGFVLAYGHATATELIESLSSHGSFFVRGLRDVVEVVLDVVDPVYIPEIVNGYTRNNNVRPVDFDKEKQAKISRKKTALAISEQEKRNAKKQAAIDEFEKEESKKKSLPKLSDMV